MLRCRGEVLDLAECKHLEGKSTGVSLEGVEGRSPSLTVVLVDLLLTQYSCTSERGLRCAERRSFFCNPPRNVIKVPFAFRADLYLAARAWQFSAIARPLRHYCPRSYELVMSLNSHPTGGLACFRSCDILAYRRGRSSRPTLVKTKIGHSQKLVIFVLALPVKWRC